MYPTDDPDARTQRLVQKVRESTERSHAAIARSNALRARLEPLIRARHGPVRAESEPQDP